MLKFFWGAINCKTTNFKCMCNNYFTTLKNNNWSFSLNNYLTATNFGKYFPKNKIKPKITHKHFLTEKL